MSFGSAKFMADRSGWTLSNLESPKIPYIAQTFHLGRHGTSLVGGDFEACDLGPVHTVLDYDVKRFGANPVTEINCPGGIEEGTEKELLKHALDELSKRTGGQLVSITHWEQGACAKNYIPRREGAYNSNGRHPR